MPNWSYKCSFPLEENEIHWKPCTLSIQSSSPNRPRDDDVGGLRFHMPFGGMKVRKAGLAP